MLNRAQELLTMFDAAVGATPDAVAVVDDRSSRTYAQLDAEAGGYAAALAARGVGRETVVAIVAERGPQYVALMLGVFRVGAAFLPVEPSTPAHRARRMCAIAGARVLLTQPGHEAYAAELTDELEPAPVVLPARTPSAGLARIRTPDRPRDGLAYVIFTSGSTGVPKGAMVTDGGMDNHSAAMVLDMVLGPDDVVGLTAPLSFDISVWQAVTALTVGGRVAVAAPENLAEPVELVAWARRHGVTILEIVPSFLAVLLEELSHDAKLRGALASLRFLVSTGEALPARLVRRWYECCPGAVVMNAYGPTECADDTTLHIVTEADCVHTAWPPIGREIANTRMYVVDAHGRELATGVEGELLIGGRGVGRGYIADPVRTALSFVPDHLSGERGTRLYRAGDRGSRAADGTINYLGRRDRQVKVRGHRVELGEIEAELLRVPGVAAAACVLADGRLHAFVTVQSGMTADGDHLLDLVRASAPKHFVPHQVTVLDQMPTTAAGKVDYRSLAGSLAAAPAAGGAAPGTPAASPLDQVRAAVAEALEVPEVAADDDFFAAGGDSLLAMTLVSLARKRFGAPSASLRGFLADPTPRGLLTVLETARREVSPAAPEVVPGALSSGQERLWFLEQLHSRKGPQLIRLELTLRGDLRVRALQHALDAVVRRHEPLRTVFSQERGMPVGTVWPQATVHIEQRTEPDGTADLLATSGLSVRTERPPLVAARLTRIAPEHHVLTVVIHHLVADGWSLAVLGREIATYYQKWVDGDTEVPLPDGTFTRYVNEERRWLASPEAVDCERYWTDQLTGAPSAIELPLSRPRPPSPDFTANHVVHELTAPETAAVVTVARARKATPFMAALAACYAVLRDLTGTADLVVGIDSVNRSWPGSEELIGTFVNQLPVRLTGSAADPTFGALLDLVRRQCLGAYEHDRLPFHKIVAALNPPRQAGRFPLFQVKVTHQSWWRAGVAMRDIEVVPSEIAEPETDLDLMLDVSGEASRLRLELVYRPEVLDGETAAAWVAAIGGVLRAGAAGPDLPIAMTATPSLSRGGGT